VFGRIYEYFLAKFSVQKAHDIEQLRAAWDLLLPKLMSGAIAVYGGNP